jgi:hypothetical protein
VLLDLAVATSFTQAGSAPIPSTSPEAPRD